MHGFIVKMIVHAAMRVESTNRSKWATLTGHAAAISRGTVEKRRVPQGRFLNLGLGVDLSFLKVVDARKIEALRWPKTSALLRPVILNASDKDARKASTSESLAKQNASPMGFSCICESHTINQAIRLNLKSKAAVFRF